MLPLILGWIIGGAVALAIVVPLQLGMALSILIGLVCGFAGVTLASRVLG